ncbi:MAG: CHAT domain-containing protein [Acidobacteriota bacterium]|nr:CHAT domain-containing protein [Acidobacteriota bacterium]
MKHSLNLSAPLSSLNPFSASHRWAFAIIILFLLGWIGTPASSTAAAFQQNIQSLEIGKPVEKTLAGGQTHNYSVTLNAGQFLHVVIEQRGIDVAVKLFAPDGKELLMVDSPNGEQGPEPLFWLAEAAGSYRIEVSSGDKQAQAGRYEARLAALRPATESDKARATAARAVAEAENLSAQTDATTRESRRQKYEEALRLWRQINDQRGIAAALTALGDLQRQASQPRQAADYYQQALPVWRALREQFDEGETLHRLGMVNLNLGETRAALDYLNQALPLRRATKDRVGEAVTLYNIGLANSNLGEKRRAVSFYEQSLKLIRALGDRAQEAQVLNSLATAYADLSDLQRALNIYAQALPLRRDPRGRAFTLASIGRSYDMLGASQEALNYYNQSLPLTRTAGDKRTEAITLNYMGLSYWALGDYQRALSAFDQALPLRREAQDRSGEAATFNNIGLVNDTLGDRQKALDAYNQALPVWRALGNRQGEAYTLNNLGFAYDALGNKQQALEHHQRALQLSREVGDRQREAKIRYGLARLSSQSNQLKPARQQIEETIKIVESLRQKVASPELRAAYRASVQQYYDLYIDVLMRMGKRAPKSGFVAEALQVSERARARSLIELLTEASADIRQGVDIKLVERERELQEQINDKTTEQIRLLGTRAKAEQIAAAGKEVEKLNSDLRDAQAQIRTTSPRYANLTQPEPLTVRQIQRLLDANTMLLEFSLGEERSYLWAATSTAIYSYVLPKRAEIEAAAKRFYGLVTARNQYVDKESNQQKQARIAQADAESLTAAAALGRMLLTPAAPLLGSKRLIIVADGALQYVPFGALLVRTAQSSKPLIASHEMVSLPSASTLAALRSESAQRQKAPKTIAVFADPVFEVKDDRIKIVSIKAEDKADNKADGQTNTAAKPSAKPAEVPLAASDLSRILLYKSAKDSGATDAEFRIPRLPNTRREAETILSLASGNAGKATFDFAATRAAATSDDLSQYRILHYATHGFLNSLNPELSGLVLSMVDEQGKSQNGYLLAPEIYNMKLPATELVVLSACQTGLGKEIRGEGVVGLTRGFMYAGAPRVVVSLWSVNDRSTADLMKHFYEAMLAKGQRPSAALRSAQVQLMQSKQWQAPYYWAAFGLQGEWR